MRNWLVKRLGGMTRLEHLEKMEALRKRCEDFAVEHLVAKEGLTLCNDGHLQHEYLQTNVLVIGSRVKVYDSRVSAIYAAPWVTKLFVVGVNAERSNLLDVFRQAKPDPQ